MGKAPSDQWYFSDWLRDVELQMASSSTRGIWMNMLCHMWFSKIRGEISGSKEKIAQICNATTEEFGLFCEEAERLRFCDISVTNNKNVQINNRRMHRQEKGRESNRLRQEKHRAKSKSNAEITPPSPSPSPSPSPKLEELSNDSSRPQQAEGRHLYPQCPHDKIIALYHKILPELPTVKIWNNGQKKLLRGRWKEAIERQSLTWWEEYFAYVRESGFLMGKKNEFCADMEWIVRPANMAKIMNGRYHRDRGSPSQKHNGITEWLRIREEKRYDIQG